MEQINPSESKILLRKGYKLTKKIGEGAYAKVFLTEFHSRTSERKSNLLACKIIDTSKSPKELKTKFLPRELDILVRLKHPHVIHIHSIFQRKAKYFIFMRYAEHGDLLEQIINRGCISEAQSRIWTRQIGLAIQYLHKMDVAHRDLKCENCLLTANNNIKLGDFGFSRFVIDSTGKQVLSSTYCGSLAYAAPEVLRGKPHHPKISDMWSLGVIVYLMLNKAMPFDDSNTRKLYEYQMSRKWKFRSTVATKLSEDVKTLVYNLMEPEVKERWNIHQVVTSNWIKMDERLIGYIQDESDCLLQAEKERESYMEDLKKKSHTSIEIKSYNKNKDMNVLKVESKGDARESLETDPNESAKNAQTK